jgi:hypothetical protein
MDRSKLRRIEYQAERCEFADPNQDQPWVLWLRNCSEIEWAYAEDLAEELIAKHVTGGFRLSDGSWAKDPLPVLDDANEMLPVSASSIRMACRLVVMQDAPVETEEINDPIEILKTVPYYPVAWRELQGKCLELRYPETAKQSGNLDSEEKSAA